MLNSVTIIRNVYILYASENYHANSPSHTEPWIVYLYWYWNMYVDKIYTYPCIPVIFKLQSIKRPWTMSSLLLRYGRK